MPISVLSLFNTVRCLQYRLHDKLRLLATIIFICLSFSFSASVSAADEISGELDVIHKDDFDSHIHLEDDYFIRDDNGVDWYQLEFDRVPPGHLRSGQRLKLRGQFKGHKFRVESLEEETSARNKSNNASGGDFSPVEMESSGLTYAQAIDERRAVVIMVDLANAKTGSYITPAQVAGFMFTDSRSVDGLYRTASLGKISFPADTDGDGQPDVFGPFTINYDNSTCNYYEWATAAEAAAQAAGVDLARYRHRVFVLPRTTELPSCSWAGVANQGCGTFCRAWIASARGSVYVHELGHNLNMAHATNDPENDGVINDEYGDYSDPMGASGLNWYMFNAPHVDQMGWYAGIPGAISTVISSGTYNLAAIGLDPGSVNGAPFMLKIAKPDSNDFYYLSYRQPIGTYNQLSNSYTKGINIHRYRGSDAGKTRHIRTLIDGETFTDNTNGISFTQVTQGNGFATVQVSYGCAPATPAIAVSPATLALRSGTTANFTVTVANKDLTGCGDTTFALDFSGGNIHGWLSPVDFRLPASQSGNSTLTVDTQLAEGSYPFTVFASDIDGQAPHHTTSIQSNATLVIDNTPPSTPTGLTGSVDSQSQIVLTWQAASDTLSGVEGYQVYRNNELIGNTAGNSFTDNTAASGASYEYAVSARDKVGNASFLSTSVLVVTGSSTSKEGKGSSNGRKK